eukprot:Sdes_comp17856_c0_seq1m7124
MKQVSSPLVSSPEDEKGLLIKILFEEEKGLKVEGRKVENRKEDKDFGNQVCQKISEMLESEYSCKARVNVMETRGVDEFREGKQSDKTLERANLCGGSSKVSSVCETLENNENQAPFKDMISTNSRG